MYTKFVSRIFIITGILFFMLVSISIWVTGFHIQEAGASSKINTLQNNNVDKSISVTGLLSYTVAMTLTEPSPNIEGLTYDGENFWVANPEDDLLHKVDSADGTVLLTIPAPGNDSSLWGGPDGLAWDGTNLWVMSDHNNPPYQIYKVDPTNGNILTSFDSPGPNSDGLTFDGTYLYLSDSQSNRIYIIDPSDGLMVDSFMVPGERLEDLAWDGSHLWYADNLGLRIYQFNLDQRIVVDYFDFPTRGGLVWANDHLWTSQEEYLVGLQIHEPLKLYLPTILK